VSRIQSSIVKRLTAYGLDRILKIRQRPLYRKSFHDKKESKPSKTMFWEAFFFYTPSKKRQVKADFGRLIVTKSLLKKAQ